VIICLFLIACIKIYTLEKSSYAPMKGAAMLQSGTSLQYGTLLHIRTFGRIFKLLFSFMYLKHIKINNKTSILVYYFLNCALNIFKEIRHNKEITSLPASIFDLLFSFMHLNLNICFSVLLRRNSIFLFKYFIKISRIFITYHLHYLYYGEISYF